MVPDTASFLPLIETKQKNETGVCAADLQSSKITYMQHEKKKKKIPLKSNSSASI